MQTVITAKCVDQTLRITNLPKLTSGGAEEVRIEVTFDELWSGLGKTAVFYRNKGKVYQVVMVDDACVIPYEVMMEPGKVYFGVVGVQGVTMRTSEVVALTVEQGAIVAAVTVPLPDVYAQILTAYGAVDAAVKAEASTRAAEVAVERARIDNLVANGTAGDNAELVDVRVGYDGTTYTSAGEAVRGQVDALLGQVNLGEYNLIRTANSPNNKICKHDLIPGYYVNNGIVSEGPDWNVTPYIPVTGGAYIYMENTGLSCFYDANKNFISNQAGVGSGAVSVPSNAAFIRCSILTERADTCAVYAGQLPRLYDDGVSAIWKLPYENGYIRFTVPVNQYRANADANSNSVTDSAANIVDVDCILSLPSKDYSDLGKPVKLVMLCHGAGKGVSGTGNWTENEGYNAIVRALNTNGYAVFDCNGFANDELGYSFWGDIRGLEAWRKAYDYVTQNYNVEKNFSVYGFSMGGLTAMNLMLQGFPGIKCMALGSPVLSMEAVWGDAGVTAVLRTLYDIPASVTEYNGAYFRGIDPFKHIATVEGANFCTAKTPPLKVWFGSAETGTGGAVEKLHAKDYVDAITNSGGLAFYREVSGAGHEISYGMNAAVVSELVMWFDRFNL